MGLATQQWQNKNHESYQAFSKFQDSRKLQKTAQFYGSHFYKSIHALRNPQISAFPTLNFSWASYGP